MRFWPARDCLVTTVTNTEAQIRGFIAKFAPANRTLIRASRRLMRARLRGAVEMVYDNYNFLVFGFSPDDRPSHAILSLAADRKGVALFFLHGVKLADPKKLLTGSGTQVRSMRLASAAQLKEPAVEALIAEAVKRGAPFASEKGRVEIRLISKKQRPRQ